MALKYVKKSHVGIDIEYWRIEIIYIYHALNKVEVSLCGYINETYRRKNEHFVEMHNVSYPLTDFIDAEPDRSVIYTKLKESKLSKVHVSGDVFMTNPDGSVMLDTEGQPIPNEDAVYEFVEMNPYVIATDV